jgi:hypothetical protein
VARLIRSWWFNFNRSKALGIAVELLLLPISILIFGCRKAQLPRLSHLFFEEKELKRVAIRFRAASLATKLLFSLVSVYKYPNCSSSGRLIPAAKIF